MKNIISFIAVVALIAVVGLGLTLIPHPNNKQETAKDDVIYKSRIADIFA